MRNIEKELGEMAVDILRNCEIVDEDGTIRVDDDALFRFMLLSKLVAKEPA